MDVRKYINMLDPENSGHRELVVVLAKAKANFDVLKEKRHRQDPTLLAAAKEFRTACDNVRRAATTKRFKEITV